MEASATLLRWGGFPEPFQRQQTRQHRLWLRERRELIVREDLRDLSRVQLLSHVEALVELLAGRSGQRLSYQALREDLQVALDSVRLWVGYLDRLFFILLVRPYAGKLARALRREPKIYLSDRLCVGSEGLACTAPAPWSTRPPLAPGLYASSHPPLYRVVAVP